jgi:hypothetical protein
VRALLSHHESAFVNCTFPVPGGPRTIETSFVNICCTARYWLSSSIDTRRSALSHTEPSNTTMHLSKQTTDRHKAQSGDPHSPKQPQGARVRWTPRTPPTCPMARGQEHQRRLESQAGWPPLHHSQ